MATLYRIEVKCRKTMTWKGFCHVTMPHPKDEQDYRKSMQEMLDSLPGPEEDQLTDPNRDGLFFFTQKGYTRYQTAITSLVRKWKARIMTVTAPEEQIRIGTSGLQATIHAQTVAQLSPKYRS